MKLTVTKLCFSVCVRVCVRGCVFLPTHFTELEGWVKLMTSGQQKHSVVYTRVQSGLWFKSSPEPIGG